MKKKRSDKDKGFWEEGYFAETLGSEEMKERMRTFHMKHDEEMNYNCKECNRKISVHQRDWHGIMCDDCFNKSFMRRD